MGIGLALTVLLFSLALSCGVDKEKPSDQEVHIFFPFCEVGVEELCKDDPSSCARCEVAMPTLGEIDLPDANKLLTTFNDCLPDGMKTIELPSNEESGLPNEGKRPRGSRFNPNSSPRDTSIHICKEVRERVSNLKNRTLETDMRCCFGQKIGKITKERKMNVTELVQKIKTKISGPHHPKKGTADDGVKNALLKGVTECVDKITDCNLVHYKDCVVKTCVKSLNGRDPTSK